MGTFVYIIYIYALNSFRRFIHVYMNTSGFFFICVVVRVSVDVSIVTAGFVFLVFLVVALLDVVFFRLL